MKYVLLLPLLTLIGCLSTPADECKSTITTPAQSVTGPRTITLNQKADYIVKYQPQNTCGSFTGFAEGTSGGVQLVAVNMKYEGCSCAAANATQAIYTFQPTKTGTYYLRFLASNSDGYITDTLTVN